MNKFQVSENQGEFCLLLMIQNDHQEFLTVVTILFASNWGPRFEKHFHWFPKPSDIAKIEGTGPWHAAKWYREAYLKNSQKSKSNSLRNKRKEIASAAEIKRRSILEQIFRAQSTR